MVEDGPAPSKSTLHTIGELGPKWITAITGLIVALTGAGFLVGHVTASPATAAQPTVTAQSTVTVTKTSQQTPAASTSSSTAPIAMTSADGSSGSSAPASANGKQLGSYNIRMSVNYFVPLDTTQPAQTQFNTSSIGDISSGAGYISPVNGNKLVALPGGTKPTYQACSTSTTFATNVVMIGGASACIIETSGKLAGVYVDSVQGSYGVLDVTVWQYTQ